MPGPLQDFLWGAIAMGCVVAALFFGHYWRLARDRLFVFFALAFAALAANYCALALIGGAQESRHWVYVLRLVAFALIIAGIVDKNRRRGDRATSS